MKVGILTFHDGINYGGFWQVYCMHKLLDEMGVDNEIINYKSLRFWLMEYACVLLHKSFRPFMSNIKRIAKFRKQQKRMRRSPFSCFSHCIDWSAYDAVIVGSDEVWNYEHSLCGFDPTFFGINVKAKKIISYSASFGSAGKVSKYDEIIRKGLMHFEAISVRDNHSADIVEKLTGEKPQITLDPTLLYQIKDDGLNCDRKDYILIYSIRFSPKVVEQIRSLAKNKNKRIISVGYYLDWCDECLIDIGPREFYRLVQNAYCVVTSMYHGALFSIKLKKRFCAIPPANRKTKFSILKNLNLTEFLWNEDRSVEEIVDMVIDQKNLTDKLNGLRENSLRYLRRELC